jgi:WD40 repeat protein
MRKNYILAGNNSFIKSYDFNENKIYHKYVDKTEGDDGDNEDHDSIIILNEEIIKIIESSEDGNIRIWDFHSGILLKKISISQHKLYGICLWSNDYLIVSGNRILSLAINNETNNIHILNPSGQLLLNIKIDNELNNPVLEELEFNNEYKGVTKLYETKYYYLREIDYNGADVNFFFYPNSTIDNNYLIIRGYVSDYDLIKLISEQKLIKPDFGEEIYGKFDNRTNMGLIVFEKEKVTKNKFISDFYYLIEIESNSNLSDISMNIFASSKKESQFSIPINKYISGSFNLTNNRMQSQEYYINEFEEENNENLEKNFTIEFSTNCECIELNFCNGTTEMNTRKKGGGTEKYFINIKSKNKNINCIRVQTKSKYEYSDKSLEKANYILRYFETNNEEFDFELNLQGVIKNEGNIPVLEITNNIAKNNTFTGFFIYMRKKRNSLMRY